MTSYQSIKKWQAGDQPRERLLASGPEGLSDAELIAILLRSGTRNKSAIDIAKELLEKNENSLAMLSRLSVHDIMKVKGLGITKAVTISAALEIGRRRTIEPALTRKQIGSSIDAFQLLHPGMRDLTQEVFKIILLDRRSKVIAIEEIHQGGMSAMVVDPKVIFRKALERAASSLILSHNHPSGSPLPSQEDMRLTDKIKGAGLMLDISVLDHVIIGDGVYYSFADEGKM